MRSPLLALLACCFASTACSTNPEDGAQSDESDILLEQAPISTQLPELRAGQPYVPGLDEAPPQIGNNGCITGAQITVAPGNVLSSAAAVQSRRSLGRELGFDISGTIPVAGGLSGAAGLVSKASFDSQSATILFQSTGTYESVLGSAEAMPTFDAANVGRCGYGYVARATHRVTAALLVNIRSTNNGSDVKATANLGKAGIAEGKASLSNLIRQGQVELSIRLATDLVPEMPSAPLSDTVLVVGETDAAKDEALKKLDSLLAWLGTAQTAIEGYLIKLQTKPAEAPPAPTKSVRFRFYPSTPRDVRTTVEGATANVVQLRHELAKTTGLVEAWTTFGEESKARRGFDWNVPLQPAKTVEELDARRRMVLEDDGGKLTHHLTRLEGQLGGCIDAIRNDGSAAADQLGRLITNACTRAPQFPVDERMFDLRPIAASAVGETMDASPGCGRGFRMPLAAEIPLFAPWSRSLPGDMGIWLEKDECNFGRSWLQSGEHRCSAFIGSSKGLTICISREGGPTPDP
jgi:hypothetical protein